MRSPYRERPEGAHRDEWSGGNRSYAKLSLGITPNMLSVTMAQAEQQLEDVFEMIYTDEKTNK